MPHFITSAQPEDHITSANDAHLYAGLFGNGNYLLNVREFMAVTMIDSNTLRILGGDALTCGRHWEITGDYEEVSIDNGVPGFNRIDLVVAHIETAPQESISLRVIKGQETENTPTVPGHVTGDLNDGDTVTEVPICSVRINGINPSEPVKLLTTILPTITDLINTDRLVDKLITTAKLADGSVSLAKIIDGAVGNTKLAANAVSEDKIQNGVVSANKLASNSVNAAKIVDGSVGTAELASSAVTTAKIADKNITLAKLDQSLQNSISQTTGMFTKNANVKNGDFNLFKSGKLCFLRGSYINLAAALSGYSERNIGTVPSGFRPTIQSWGVGVQDNGSFAIKVNTDGSTLVRALDKQIGTSTSCWFLIVYYTA